MIRTQISLSEEQMRRARAEAERRGISLAAVIRDALDRTLGEGDRMGVRERARTAVGGFRSGAARTSEDHDDALAEGRRW